MKALMCPWRINKVSHLLSYNLILSHPIPVLFHLIPSQMEPCFVAISLSGSDVYLTVCSGRWTLQCDYMLVERTLRWRVMRGCLPKQTPPPSPLHQSKPRLMKGALCRPSPPAVV